MSDKSVTVGSYNLFNFKSPGATPGIMLRYGWHNNQGDESGLSFGVTFPVSVKDTFTAFNSPGSKPPTIFNTVDYNYNQYTFFYHYNKYILETQYNDALAFYIAGSGGITVYSYGKVDQIDRNHFTSTYQYRGSGFSLMGEVAWGTHYQFYNNLRVVGETGPYLFKEKELKLRGEPNDWRMGWGLMIGLEFGF
ncbi:MAG: hypothetical protein HYZ42_17335 [Bacteroidetes bacterium]|nr:hypothetical protein [Bacteroidota bacterium]